MRNVNQARRGPAMRLPRMTMQHRMIAVAGSSVVFACFGVTFAAAMGLAAFLVSALIAKPGNWQEWLVLLLGALAALPSILSEEGDISDFLFSPLMLCRPSGLGRATEWGSPPSSGLTPRAL